MRCRADHAYPGRPLQVWDGSRWQTVTEIIEESQTPKGRCYHVVCEHENEFWLVYDPDQDGWQVTAAGAAGKMNQKECQ